MCEVTINKSVYWGGRPNLDTKTIVINGVSISLSKDTFSDLCKVISEDVSTNIDTLIRLDEKYNTKVGKVQSLINDIRKTFYDCEDPDFAIKKCIEDVVEEELDKLLDKNSKLLGFE